MTPKNESGYHSLPSKQAVRAAQETCERHSSQTHLPLRSKPTPSFLCLRHPTFAKLGPPRSTAVLSLDGSPPRFALFDARFTMSFACYATAATNTVLQSSRLEGFNSQTVASRLIVAIRRD